MILNKICIPACRSVTGGAGTPKRLVGRRWPVPLPVPPQVKCKKSGPDIEPRLPHAEILELESSDGCEVRDLKEARHRAQREQHGPNQGQWDEHAARYVSAPRQGQGQRDRNGDNAHRGYKEVVGPKPRGRECSRGLYRIEQDVPSGGPDNMEASKDQRPARRRICDPAVS